MSLNQNQLRAVSIRLRLLEERLEAMTDLMERDARGVLFHRDRPRLTVEQRARIDSLVAQLRSEIALLAQTFDLPSEEQDAAGKIVGLLAMTWQSLGDIRSERLAGHGEVDPGLRATLDPSVDRLLALVLALEKEASGAR